jgi:hypothetical protein
MSSVPAGLSIQSRLTPGCYDSWRRVPSTDRINGLPIQGNDKWGIDSEGDALGYYGGGFQPQLGTGADANVFPRGDFSGSMRRK